MAGKRYYYGVLFFIALFLIVPQLTAQEEAAEQTKLEVRCFKNIEVFCTLINLTDYWEERHTDFPFAAEARNRFLPFKDHQAVKLTDRILKKHWHIFFCGLALYLSEFPEAKIIYPPPVEFSDFSISYWFFKKVTMEDYISAVRDFYQVSGYEESWQEKQVFYQDLEANLEEKIKDVDIPGIMEDFYGMKKERYFIVPAPQMPDMALNVELVSDGKRYSYYVQGPLETRGGEDYFIHVGDLVTIAFHEFGHTFLETALDNNEELLEKYDYIYKKAKKGMRRKGYRTWHQVFIENLIGATEARFIGKALGDKYSQLVLKIKAKKGYHLVPVLYDILGDYEQNRDKYRDFEAFMPQLFVKLDQRMKNK